MQPWPEVSAAVEAAHEEEVGEHVCRGCGYSLAGLIVSQNCPECALPVASSMRGDNLADAGPAYLASLREGSMLMLIALPFSALLTIVGFFKASVVLWLATGVVNNEMWLLMVINLPAGALIALAHWRLTTPDVSLAATEPGWSARRVARVATVGRLACQFLLLVFTTLGMSATFTPNMTAASITLAIIAALPLLLGWVFAVVRFIATIRYLAILADRLPDAAYAARARRCSWLLPVIAVAGLLLLVGPLVAAVWHWVLHYQMWRRLPGPPAHPPLMP